MNLLRNLTILADDLGDKITQTANELTGTALSIVSGVVGGLSTLTALILIARILIVFLTQYKGDDKGAEQMAQAKQKIKSLVIASVFALIIGAVGFSGIVWVKGIFTNM